MTSTRTVWRSPLYKLKNCPLLIWAVLRILMLKFICCPTRRRNSKLKYIAKRWIPSSMKLLHLRWNYWLLNFQLITYTSNNLCSLPFTLIRVYPMPMPWTRLSYLPFSISIVSPSTIKSAKWRYHSALLTWRKLSRNGEIWSALKVKADRYVILAVLLVHHNIASCLKLMWLFLFFKLQKLSHFYYFIITFSYM